MGEDNTVLLLANVTRAMHDTIVKCEVKNEVGKSEESETLDISCEFIFDCAPSRQCFYLSSNEIFRRPSLQGPTKECASRERRSSHPELRRGQQPARHHQVAPRRHSKSK
jgi:hypothetical protein